LLEVGKEGKKVIGLGKGGRGHAKSGTGRKGKKHGHTQGAGVKNEGTRSCQGHEATMLILCFGMLFWSFCGVFGLCFGWGLCLGYFRVLFWTKRGIL